MKQRKEFERPEPRKTASGKTVQELTDQIRHIVGKKPEKAAKAIENWVKDVSKPTKKAS